MKLSGSQLLLSINAAMLSAGLVALSIILWQSTTPKETDYPSVSDFALLDQEGNFHKLSRLANTQGVVLYVYGVGCPIAQNHLPELMKLRKEYENSGIEFRLLNCNPQDDRASLQQDLKERNIDIPVLKDDAQLVMDELGIKRTCESFLIDPKNRKIVFHGPLDDRLGYESQKKEADHHYLKDAIEAHLSGIAVESPDEEIRGCLISRAAGGQPTNEIPVYATEVAPILQARCYACHSEGGTAPWEMGSYSDIVGWSAMIREVILTKRMPPRQPDMHYLPFSETHGILPSESSTLMRWIDAGMPRGNGDDPLIAAKQIATDRRYLTDAKIQIQPRPQWIPATGELDYRYDAMQLPVTEDVWVHGGVVESSEPELLHHALCYVVPNEQDDAGSQKNPTLNFAHPDPNTWNAKIIAAAVPGMDSTLFPQNTGHKLSAGSILFVQYHYTTNGKISTDFPDIRVALHDTPPLFELEYEILENHTFKIPPEVSEYRVEDDFIPENDILLFGILPHMHYRGTSFRCELMTPDGTKKTIFSMPNYNMDWQGIYWFAEPFAVPKGTKIIGTGIYDNSPMNELNPDPSKEVTYSTQTSGEMFHGWLIYSQRTERNAAEFDKVFRKSQSAFDSSAKSER